MSIALITGSSGHVGSNLIRELSKQDYKIRCIDFDGDYRAYEGFDVEVIKGDITNKDSLRSVFKNVDIISLHSFFSKTSFTLVPCATSNSKKNLFLSLP